MFSILKWFFFALTLLLAAYNLLSQNFAFQGMMIFSLGAFLLTRAFEDINQEKKVLGYIQLCASAFIILSSFQVYIG
ncbi:hypothetical protein [Metabacillus sp. 84]|uniref:hypothetical protein n=1 Tax=unclassified Metabacillus TaxID=2675274 RepID=UPI003CEE5A7F